VKYAALAVVGGAVGYLVARFLLPAILERGVVSLVFPIMMVATLLFVRALRRVRSGS
jgi:hypothetical protein